MKESLCRAKASQAPLPVDLVWLFAYIQASTNSSNYDLCCCCSAQFLSMVVSEFGFVTSSCGQNLLREVIRKPTQNKVYGFATSSAFATSSSTMLAKEDSDAGTTVWTANGSRAGEILCSCLCWPQRIAEKWPLLKLAESVWCWVAWQKREKRVIPNIASERETRFSLLAQKFGGLQGRTVVLGELKLFQD